MGIPKLKLGIHEKSLIMKTLVEKEFDCVSEVRKERARIAMDTSGKSPSEILEYFRKRKASFREKVKPGE